MPLHAPGLLAGIVLLGEVLAASLLLGCSSISQRDTGAMEVLSEGWAPANAKEPAAARRQALADAKRKAVEQVSGTAVSSLLYVKNAALISEKMIAHSQGFVSRFDILDEKEEAGFLKVRIKALIRIEESNTPTIHPPTDARISLSIKGMDIYDKDLGITALSAIRRELLAKNFNIDDSTDSWPMQGNADIAPVLDSRIGAFHSARAHVTLRVMKPQTSIVIWEMSQEASALGLDPGSAAIEASRTAGMLAGRKAAIEVSELLWKHF